LLRKPPGKPHIRPQIQLLDIHTFSCTCALHSEKMKIERKAFVITSRGQSIAMSTSTSRWTLDRSCCCALLLAQGVIRSRKKARTLKERKRIRTDGRRPSGVIAGPTSTKSRKEPSKEEIEKTRTSSRRSSKRQNGERKSTRRYECSSYT